MNETLGIDRIFLSLSDYRERRYQGDGFKSPTRLSAYVDSKFHKLVHLITRMNL